MLLNDEQKLILETARLFSAEKLAPNASKWDRESHFPAEAVAEMGALGFMGMLVPPEWDGAGADHVSYALALMAVAEGDGSCSTIMSVHNSVACMPLLKFGTLDQQERFLKPLARGEKLGAFCLTEPQAGSDAAALKTRATRDGNHYVLNGVKQFITSGANRRIVAIVFAVTDPSTRARRACRPSSCRPKTAGLQSRRCVQREEARAARVRHLPDFVRGSAA